MAASTSTLTIRPWAQESKPKDELRDILSRAQRGHLRDITEASLQEEIAAEGALESSDEESDDDEDMEVDEGADKKVVWPTPEERERADLYNMKRFMLETIAPIRNEVGIAVDVVSLALSKDLPKQASTTLSPYVRERVPLGSIGTDFWQRMPIDQARQAQDSLLAMSAKMDALRSVGDGFINAAKRLEGNLKKEVQYWGQLLPLTEQGWNVCPVPGQQHGLGVRFGFSESASQFARKGIAVLNSDEHGGIRLQRGIGSKPKALRVVLRRKDTIVGVSKVPVLLDDDEMTLEARIRHARDSLFDEELYHEMIRESRNLGSFGVTVEGSSIQLQSATAQADDIKLYLELISLDEGNTLADAGDEHDRIAQALILSARLLLSQAHRDRLRKRSQPPPPLSDKQKYEKQPPLPILRPLMSLLLHHSALSSLNTYLNSLSATFTRAQIDHSSQPATFTVPPPARVKADQPQDASAEASNPDAASSKAPATAPATASSLIHTTLLSPLTSTSTLTIQPPCNAPSGMTSAMLEFRLETSLASAFGTVFTIRITGTERKLTDFVTFADAGDAVIAQSLAARCAWVGNNMDGGGNVGSEREIWKKRKGEAVLEKDAGVGEVQGRFAVALDGRTGELRCSCRASSGAETKTWTAKGHEGQGESEKGFWDFARSRLQLAFGSTT